MKSITTLFACLVSVVVMAAPGSPERAESPEPGAEAPDFRLQDQKSEWHSLEDYSGKWVILYFYPKDDTPGCTTEACNFRDDIYAFRKLGVSILGVSLDTVESHVEFAKKHSLPFPLLADNDAIVSKTYGVYRDRGIAEYARRETFVIDPQGRVARHYPDVKPADHSKELQADLAVLMNGNN